MSSAMYLYIAYLPIESLLGCVNDSLTKLQLASNLPSINLVGCKLMLLSVLCAHVVGAPKNDYVRHCQTCQKTDDPNDRKVITKRGHATSAHLP